MLAGFLVFGFAGLDGLDLCDDCGRGLVSVLALSLEPFGAAIARFSASSELSTSSPLVSLLFWGLMKWLPAALNILLWLLKSSTFCLRGAGASTSLPLSASLVAPAEEAASALPLNVSS
jgi:hypothetical protein